MTPYGYQLAVTGIGPARGISRSCGAVDAAIHDAAIYVQPPSTPPPSMTLAWSGGASDAAQMRNAAQAGTYQALIDAGMPAPTARAAALDPQLLQTVAPAHFGGPTVTPPGDDTALLKTTANAPMAALADKTGVNALVPETTGANAAGSPSKPGSWPASEAELAQDALRGWAERPAGAGSARQSRHQSRHRPRRNMRTPPDTGEPRQVRPQPATSRRRRAPISRRCRAPSARLRAS
jgi:hypothetical protein